MNIEERTERFHKVIELLQKQGTRSADNGFCKYSFGNLKCAVGHCLDQADLDIVADFRGDIFALRSRVTLPSLKIESDKDVNFYSLLQELHDLEQHWENYKLKDSAIEKYTSKLVKQGLINA